MVNPPVPTALDYLSLIGLSAIVGAGVSTVLNYFFDTQRVKKTKSD